MPMTLCQPATVEAYAAAAPPVSVGPSAAAIPGQRLPGAAAAATAAALLAACGGSEPESGAATAALPPDEVRRRTLSSTADDSESRVAGEATASTPITEAQRDAARFLAQATMGPESWDEVKTVASKGLGAWIEAQFRLRAFDHSDYLESQRGRNNKRGEPKTVSEEMSYEAVWQHWLFGKDQLRARGVWALLQIMVISNIAPDIRAVAMSSYMDMLGRHVFGNFRDLLQAVTLHPAMGYYLNMLESEKEDPAKGTHPNENYPREVMQLFTIGLIQLNLDGSPRLDAQGRPQPTFTEDVVKGYAKAFSGWAYGGLNNTKAHTFHDHDDNVERLWRLPMIAWPMWHSPGTKQLVDGRVLPAGQSPEKDLADALDSLFLHPNVGPFIGRQLIQRLVTSNPSPAYIQRVATAFNDNGRGVRGDMRAVWRAILLDPEARSGTPQSGNVRFGKQREPVLRLAAFLRGLDATSRNKRNDIHYLDSADESLGQSPLLAPSVFNFYSPSFRPAGPLAAAGLVAPEFQITSETSVVGSLNFFAYFFESGGYGNGDSRLRLNYRALRTKARDTDALIDHLDKLFFRCQMGASTRERLRSVINAVPADEWQRKIRSALLLTAMSPDFVIQK
jgi:uncharacterized protein (DUF1800 family)